MLAIASPAAAQPDVRAVQRQLDDPAMADRMTNVMQALTGAFLNLPVGEVQAAIEGRPATPVDKRTTVADLGRRDDPDFDRHIRQQIAGSGQAMRSGMKAMSSALPGMMKGLGEARAAMEKAIANMPSPAYPKQ
ncbi:MAG: hypothetical protein ABIQ32_02605 [Sphingomicrobium sp.]